MTLLFRILSWLLPELLYQFDCVLCRRIEFHTLKGACDAGWKHHIVLDGWACHQCVVIRDEHLTTATV